MKKKELIKRRFEITERLRAIADDMDAKKREMTEEEKTEVQALQREMSAIDLRIQSETSVPPAMSQKSREVRFDEILREAKNGGSNKEFVIQREAVAHQFADEFEHVRMHIPRRRSDGGTDAKYDGYGTADDGHPLEGGATAAQFLRLRHFLFSTHLVPPFLR